MNEIIFYLVRNVGVPFVSTMIVIAFTKRTEPPGLKDYVKFSVLVGAVSFAISALADMITY